jgi:hypothetical protein
MILTRDNVLKIALIPVKRTQKISAIYIIGGLLSFYLNGFNYVILGQILISLTCIFLYNKSFLHVTNNRIFDHKKILNLTDIPSIIFCLFLFVYYILYYGYKLFIVFEWLNLVLLFLNLTVLITYFKNASGYNVLVGILRQFFMADQIDIPEQEWKQVLNKWQI